MGAVGVWWIRRDLRLADNRALEAALEGGRRVVPLFVGDPALLDGTHARATTRSAFLFGGLAALDDALRARGARLLVRFGRPDEVVPAVVREVGASLVAAEEDSSPYGRRRDAAVARTAPLLLTPGLTIHHPREVTTGSGKAFTVFTPFRRAWLARGMPAARDVLPAPESIAMPDVSLRSESLPPVTPPPLFPPGEAEGHRRLIAFTRGATAPIAGYASARDRLDLASTSALSPYLRFGMLSARTAVAAALAAGADPTGVRPAGGADVWLTELVWREFYHAVLWHHPSVLRASHDRRLRGMAWRKAPAEFDAWREGRTGYPVVDAAMRQLKATGWMHNRARMIVASFLTKHLLVDWRLGERWFMERLVDGDPAANAGGWQWVAGTGTDAAPYFRVFNPTLQGRRFDPDGVFVRRWIPELANVAGPAVHEPWRLTPVEQAAAACRIGRDYPAPIVAHEFARARALAAYRACLDAARPGR